MATTEATRDYQPVDGIDYTQLILEDRVSTTLYTDTRVFEDELNRIWTKVWLYVGHDSEIPAAGDYVTRTLAGQPVILVRSRDGQVRVLLNRCRHRGNMVCLKASGTAKQFHCAYHGWTYSNSGALVAVPYPDGYGSDFSKDELGLVPVPRVDSYRGFVFASLSPDVPALREQLGLAAETFDAYCDQAPHGEIEVRSGRQRHRYAGNWKLLPENQGDGQHLKFVHSSVLGDRIPPLDNAAIASYQDLGSGNFRGFFRGSPTKSPSDEPGEEVRTGPIAFLGEISASARQSYFEALEASLGRERAEKIIRGGGTPPSTTMFPNLVMITNEIRVIEPISPSETHVSIYATTLKGAPPELNAWRLHTQGRAHGPAGPIETDDYAILEFNQAGFAAKAEEWSLISRGLNREWEENGLRTSRVTDELPIRAFWRQYRSLMTNETPNGVSGQ